MSMLIKSSALDQAVRPFAAAVPASKRVAPGPETPGPTREERLEARIAELEAELALSNEELPGKLALAREEGAAEALEMRSDAEAHALEALKAALAEAISLWSEQLEAWNQAACAIAGEVLEQVFLDGAGRAELVRAAIGKRLEHLRLAGAVRIRVSAKDFSDCALFASIAADIGPAAKLECDPELQSGECIADLKLGHVELSPGAQWRKVAELLDRLERAELRQ
jgi:flagellar biosynthesis/type III secretory pathway protein FliH